MIYTVKFTNCISHIWLPLTFIIFLLLVCNVKCSNPSPPSLAAFLIHFSVTVGKNSFLSDFIAILSFENMGLPPFKALGNSEVQMQAKIFESDFF